MYVFVLVTHKKVYTREKQMNYQNSFPQVLTSSHSLQLPLSNKTIQRVTTEYHRMPLRAGNSQLIHIQHSYTVSTLRKTAQGCTEKWSILIKDSLFSRGFHVFEVNNITSWWLI